MSNDKRVPPAQPQLPHRPIEEVASQDDMVEILRRMTQTFQLTVDTLTGERVQRFWTLTGRTGDVPEVNDFDSYEALAAFVTARREEQNRDRENMHYLFIFRGTRVQIQKGRDWHLVDGPNLVPIDAPVPSYVDDSGTLLDSKPLDDMLQAALQTAVDETAAARGTPPEPTSETPEPEVESEPERVGEPPTAEEDDEAE